VPASIGAPLLPGTGERAVRQPVAGQEEIEGRPGVAGEAEGQSVGSRRLCMNVEQVDEQGAGRVDAADVLDARAGPDGDRAVGPLAGIRVAPATAPAGILHLLP